MRSLILAFAALTACAPSTGAPKDGEPATVAEATAFAPSGDPKRIEAVPETDVRDAPWVAQVFPLQHDWARVYGTVGGDPAINGVYTYLAVFGSPIDPPSVFQIGDFNEWQVVQQEKGRFVLRVSRSWIDDATGDVKTAEEYLMVEVPEPGAETIMVTPASARG